MTREHFDVVIVGSGLSGVDAAYHLQTLCPGKSYVILESRDAIGGTWDLFRYPGIRSDSDMYTFGYSFRPWQSDFAIADGELIRTLHPRNSGSLWHRSQDPLPAPGEERIVVFCRCVVDNRSGTRRRTAASALHLQFIILVHRLLRLCSRLHA